MHSTVPSGGGLLAQVLVVGGAITLVTYFVANQGQGVPSWVPLIGQPVAAEVAPAGPAVAAAGPAAAPAKPAAPVAAAPASHPAAPPAAAPPPAGAHAAPPAPAPRTATPTPPPPPTPAAPPAPAIAFSDSFESDTVGAPPAGWKVAGDAVVALDGSHVLRAPAGRWAVAVAGSTTWASYRVGGTLKPGSSGHSRLIARYASPGNYYYCGLDRGSLRLGRVVSGSGQVLKSTPFAYTVDGVYPASLTVSGSALTCTVGANSGSLHAVTLTATDSSHPSGAAGWMGLGGGELDNFSVAGV